MFAQTSSYISDCDNFVDGPNENWPYVLVATTFADSSESQGSQTFSINISSLPDDGANFRVYKTTANGNDYFGNPLSLTLGLIVSLLVLLLLIELLNSNSQVEI